MDAKVVAGHVRTLSYGDDEAKARAAKALVIFMESPETREEYRNAITAAGAIFLLVEIIKSRVRATPKALKLLSWLSTSMENSNAIAAAGGSNGSIALFVELMRSGSESQKKHATLTLANLAADSDERQIAIMTAGGLPLAIELARSGGDKAKACAAILLQSLACHKDNGVAIALAGGIPILVALAESGHAAAKSHAAEALKNLARDNVDIELQIATTRGTAALVDMARHGGFFERDAAKDVAARLLAERRRSIVHKCVDGKVPAELEPIVARYLSRRGYS
jgi:vacuolar protein 8